MLRAIKVPAGEHEVIMTFDPQTVHVTEAIAYTALALLALMLIATIAVSLYRSKRQKQESNDTKPIEATVSKNHHEED